ncbi:MAG: hypothetical protein A6D91_05600 [Bacillaceae bacterium G1]|nr:hypothetical protein [Bacillota bacterium]OJF16677.1 MAG: hypothetical protein A6D91_05600 [Bacillaceae bacterium G1]
MGLRGRDVVLQAFREYGVRYIFGNPGTTELPLLDGLFHFPDMEYVMALHEDIAVGMALGYAQASGRPGVVNLHVAPGVAHGLGNLYEAWRSHVPLVVTAGQHDLRLSVQEPGLAGNLLSMVRDVTKWCWEVTRVEELPIVMQRAFKEALTHPQGPVFVSLPVDVMWQETDRRPLPLTTIRQEHYADPQAVDLAARMILQAAKPVLIVGDRVGQTGAVEAAVRLAELTGMPVYQEPMSARLNFPAAHPSFAGQLPPNGPQIAAAMADADLVLWVGVMNQAPLLYYPQALVPPSTPLIAVDLDARQLGKNGHAALAILGHPGAVMDRWAEAIEKLATPEDRARFAERQGQLREKKAQFEARKEAELARASRQAPLSPAVVMAALNRYVDERFILVEEAVTSSWFVHRYVYVNRPGSRFALKGGGLGYGLAAALGVQLARPDERVVAVVGDGSALYYIQALWNAARWQLPVIFLIVNNTSYMILKGGMLAIRGEAAKNQFFPGMDLEGPAVDFVQAARAFGVEACRVEDEAQLLAALEEAFRERKPYLLDVCIDRTPRPVLM